MGVELSLQAIPEDCELLACARQEREIAERTQFFNMYVCDDWIPESLLERYFSDSVKSLTKIDPDLVHRYAYLGGRKYDAILYLLSPARRSGDYQNDHSLIYKAIKGGERLHPEANATQGHPIGFVPAKDARIIADYLDIITYDRIYEYYVPALMSTRVYKMHPDTDFQRVWDEFSGISDLYRAAADHGEAVITVIG